MNTHPINTRPIPLPIDATALLFEADSVAEAGIDATELLEEADVTIRRADVRKAYQRIARGLTRSVRVNKLMVAGDVFDDLKSVGVAPGDMAVSLHCRVFGPKRLAQLIGQASRVGAA